MSLSASYGIKLTLYDDYHSASAADDKQAVVNTLRLRSRCANHDDHLLVVIVEQNLVGISAVILVVFYRRLPIHTTRPREDYLKT